MKNKIFAILGCLVLITSLAACGTVPANNSNTPVRQLSVTGNGKVYLTPDIAYIYIGVQSKSENVGDALTENNTKSQSVAGALNELGVESKDIQTSAFNIYPQQQFGPQGEVIKTEYVVENTVNVTVRDLTKMGQLLDTVVRSGANSINGISFDVTNRESAISEVRQKAVDDARKQAEELAAAGGVKLGKLMTINVYVNNVATPMYNGKGGAMMDTAAAQVPVSAGQLIISADANLSFEIQ